MTVNMRWIDSKVAIFELELKNVSFNVCAMFDVCFPQYWISWIPVKGNA
jgi:hypothetical protein